MIITVVMVVMVTITMAVSVRQDALITGSMMECATLSARTTLATTTAEIVTAPTPGDDCSLVTMVTVIMMTTMGGMMVTVIMTAWATTAAWATTIIRTWPTTTATVTPAPTTTATTKRSTSVSGCLPRRPPWGHSWRCWGAWRR